MAMMTEITVVRHCLASIEGEGRATTMSLLLAGGPRFSTRCEAEAETEAAAVDSLSKKYVRGF